jgi:hypothetical protein
MVESENNSDKKGGRKMKKFFVMLMGLMFLVACASTPKYQGVFVPKEYVSRFEPGPEKHTLRWIRPGVDFSKYNKCMVDYVIFALAPDSEYKGIDADEMKKLADAASLALVNALNPKHPVVSEPGPGVGRIKFAITDLTQSRPVVSAIPTVIPLGLGINLIKKGATDEWTGSGLTKAEVMFFDSMTNEVIAAGYADYSAGFTERFTKWGSVEEGLNTRESG